MVDNDGHRTFWGSWPEMPWKREIDNRVIEYAQSQGFVYRPQPGDDGWSFYKPMSNIAYHYNGFAREFDNLQK